MRNFFAGIFRSTIFPIVSMPLTYYVGMVLFRLSRKARELSYHPGEKEELHVVKFTGNLKMKVDIHSYMGGSIYWAGLHHLNEILFLRRTLSSDMIFIDVGANQGEFSVYASSKLTNGRVLAFEPVSKIRSLLRENQRINNLQNLEIYDFGLSDQEGSLPIYTTSDTIHHHGYNEGLSTLYKTDERNIFEEQVSLKVFDDIFFKQMTRIDFIKIDVEGAELYVLKGMYKSLLKFKPELLIEINEGAFNAAGYSTSELISFLKDLNYKCYGLKRGKLTSMEYTDFDRWGNYIFRAAS
ncbi:MAG: FkbM family methyltransferase [Saprospiraceae bacterium]